MDYLSHKSKGYIPLNSGPNRAGFYMGPKNNLLNMMQTGGVPSAYKKSFDLGNTAGGAQFARAMQRVSDAKTLEEYQKNEAERQKKGGIFGSVLSLGGGLLGGMIGGPAGAAIGSAFGKGLGEKWGAGKAQDVDMAGTVYGQQAFRDVGEASEEYNEGILGRAAMSGIQTGLTAGLTPGGGMYGTYNPLRPGGDGLSGMQMIKSLGSGQQGISGFTGDQGLFGFAQAQLSDPKALGKGLTRPAKTFNPFEQFTGYSSSLLRG
tara:strand:+ start:627 stop:1412 length:786 start_codon:yes stop_codon:yes gene_type:complete